MSDYKGHTHGEYDDTCPICYLDAEIDRLRAEVGKLRAEIRRLKCPFSHETGLGDYCECGWSRVSNRQASACPRCGETDPDKHEAKNLDCEIANHESTL